MTYTWQQTPIRALEQYLDDMLERLKKLPLESKARGDLVTRIRQVEHELDARDGGIA